MELSAPTHFRQAADKNKIMHIEVSLLLLCCFSAVIFSLFVFGQRQQIDDGLTEWHCILGSQDCGHKSQAIQLYNGLLSSHQRVGACYCITLVSSSEGATIMFEGGWVGKLRPGGNSPDSNELWKSNKSKKKKGRETDFFGEWKFPTLLRW